MFSLYTNCLLHSHRVNMVKHDVKLIQVAILLSSLFFSPIGSLTQLHTQFHRCLPVAQNGEEQQGVKTPPSVAASLTHRCRSLTFI